MYDTTALEFMSAPPILKLLSCYDSIAGIDEDIFPHYGTYGRNIDNGLFLFESIVESYLNKVFDAEDFNTLLEDGTHDYSISTRKQSKGPNCVYIDIDRFLCFYQKIMKNYTTIDKWFSDKLKLSYKFSDVAMGLDSLKYQAFIYHIYNRGHFSNPIDALMYVRPTTSAVEDDKFMGVICYNIPINITIEDLTKKNNTDEVSK